MIEYNSEHMLLNSLSGCSCVQYNNKSIPSKIGVLRIDDKIINPKFASRLLKARK